MSGRKARCLAPCKLNLHLAVGPRRADGYHALASLFQMVALADLVEARIVGDSGADAAVLGLPGVPDDRNSLLLALRAFREETGFRGSVEFRVEKRVPEGSGLGGGSSDAVAALRCLDALAGTGLADPALERLALAAGSDAPFFVGGGTALVGGRGERLERIRCREDLAFVIAWPGFSSSTAKAYADFDAAALVNLDAAALINLGAVPGMDANEPSFEGLAEAFRGPPEEWPFRNDLAGPVMAEAPKIASLLGDIGSLKPRFAAMSGSGSSCFGVFGSVRDAIRAAAALSSIHKNVFTSFPLARCPKPILQ